MKNRTIFLSFILLLASLHLNTGNAWWNESWQNRTFYEVNDTSSEFGANWSVPVNVTYKTGMNPDFSDVQPVNYSDNETLDYWIQDKVDSEWALFWIKTSTFNQSYPFYWNSTFNSSGVNGSNVFLKFDVDTFVEGGLTGNFIYNQYNGTAWVITQDGMNSFFSSENFTNGTSFVTKVTPLFSENGSNSDFHIHYLGVTPVLNYMYQGFGYHVFSSGQVVILESDDGVTTPVIGNNGNQTSVYEIARYNSSIGGVRYSKDYNNTYSTVVETKGNRRVGFAFDDNSFETNLTVWYAFVRNVTSSGTEPLIVEGLSEGQFVNNSINLTIISPVNITYFSNQISLNVTANDTASAWWYELDGNGTNVTFTPNTTIFGLSVGTHNLSVWVNNSGGNLDNEVVYFITGSTINLTVYSPENVSYSLFPTGFYSNGTGFRVFNLDFTLNDTLDTVLYSLDGGVNVSVAGNVTFTVGSAGVHTITVFANNTFGSSDIESVTFTWVDTSLGSLGRDVGGLITGMTNPIFNFILNIVLAVSIGTLVIGGLFMGVSTALKQGFNGFKLK